MPLLRRFDADPSQQMFERHPYLVGRLKGDVRLTESGKTATIGSDHTRWTGSASAEPNAIRVAVLGGSTTFGTKVTDADSWPALLQGNLGPHYVVTNYGVPGYSTAEAIIQMSLLFPEPAPQVVVFYGGWNDLKNYHTGDLGPDYYGHEMSQYGNLGIPLMQEHESVKAAAVRVSAVFALAHKLSELIAPPPTESASVGRIYTTPDSFVDRLYVRNLETLDILGEKQTSNHAVRSAGAELRKFPRHEGELAMVSAHR